MRFWTADTVVGVKILSMIAMAAVLAGPLSADDRAAGWRFPSGKPWSDGTSSHLTASDGRLTLASGVGEGTFETPVLPLGKAYDRLVPSWNARTPEGSTVTVQARAYRGGKPVSEWLTVATWSKSARGPRDAASGEAKLDQDTIMISKGADAAALKAILKRGTATESPRLDALGMTAFASAAKPSSAVTSHGGAAHALPIPFRSQSTAAPGIAARVCGPTSTSMALAYHGVDLTIDAVAALAKDPPGSIQYGNWAYLAATAAELGMDTEVRAMNSLDEVVRELKAGHPVIMAISFGAGELPGSPISKTAGHLILARGYDKDGNVLVNDPAGRTVQTGQIRYDRVPLTKAWKRGIGIIIRKP
jgi:hypothetical protein